MITKENIDDTKLLIDACKGDLDAVSLMEQYIHIASVWDDLVDKDKEVSNIAVSNAFISALISIPQNPFYRKHSDELIPVLESTILNWLASEELVKGDYESKVVAHVIRFDVVTFFLKILQLIGGYEWAIQWSPVMWKTGMKDTLEHFLSEHK